MFFKIICGVIKLCFVIVPVTDYFVKPLHLFPSKFLGAINIYRQKGKKRGYLQYSTVVLQVSGSFSQRKNYFEIVILKLNCFFHTSSMVSTTSKYQLFKKNINFFIPGFSQNDYISKANKEITYSPFDMTCVTPNLLNLIKLFQLFPTGSKNL